MMRIWGKLLIPLFVLPLPPAVPAQTSIRINQVGYTPRSLKCAVLGSETAIGAPRRFFVCDALTDSILWESGEIRPCGPWGPFQETWRLDFTRFEEEGGVCIRAGSAQGTDIQQGRTLTGISSMLPGTGGTLFLWGKTSSLRTSDRTTRR